MHSKTPPVARVSVSTAEKPVTDRLLVKSGLDTKSGEALLSEAELIRQLREHGWINGDPGVLIRPWTLKEVS